LINTAYEYDTAYARPDAEPDTSACSARPGTEMSDCEPDASARRAGPDMMMSESELYRKDMSESEQYQKDFNESELYWMWLCSAPDLTPQYIAILRKCFYDARGVYEASDSDLLACALEDKRWAKNLIRFRQSNTPEKIAELHRRKAISFVSRRHPLFPPHLKSISDCPAGLFYRGRLPDPERPTAAIIGARRCSNYGSQITTVISRMLTRAGFQIISGMAMGIDGQAQRTCLAEGGSSFAVLGGGPDVVYPEENRGLYYDLVKQGGQGGVLSEYPSGTASVRYHFPMRNRIISGLSDVVIVTEARERSGTLITADFALEQGREVYAVPGRYNDQLSAGCNRLIEQGATIIVSAQGLLKDLSLRCGLVCEETDPKKLRRPPMTEKEQAVYACLDLDPVRSEDLLARTGLSIYDISTALLNLQLSGLVTETGINSYARTAEGLS